MNTLTLLMASCPSRTLMPLSPSLSYSLPIVCVLHFLLPRLQPAPSAGFVVSSRGSTFLSRFLPPYIELLESREVLTLRHVRIPHRRSIALLPLPLDATTAAST
jgi:hypothetical protein